MLITAANKLPFLSPWAHLKGFHFNTIKDKLIKFKYKKRKNN